MKRLLAIAAGLALVAAIAMAFAAAYVWWFGMPAAEGRSVMALFAAVTALVALLFVLGQALSVKSHAYYVIAGGVAFFGADVVLWKAFGIMPGPKSFQDGFMPAAMMGLFLGPLYRIAAFPMPHLPRDPPA